MKSIRLILSYVASVLLGTLATANPGASTGAGLMGPPIAPVVQGNADEAKMALELENLHELVFGYHAAFEQIEYYFPAPVTGTGIWAGANQDGIGFTLDIEHFAADDLELVAAQDPIAYQVLLAHQVQGARMLGKFTAGGNEVTVGGQLLSFVHPVSGPKSYFMPTGDPQLTDLTFVPEELDPAWEYQGDTADGGSGESSFNGGGGQIDLFCVSVQYPALATTPECLQCITDHQAKLDDIANDLQAKLSSLWTNYQLTALADSLIYLGTMATIQINWYVDLAAALIFSPPPFNWISLGAGYVKKMVQQAAATAAYVLRRASEKAKYEKAVQDAYQEAKKATDKANEELKDCLDANGCILTCTATFCYFLVWENLPELGPTLVASGWLFAIACQ